MNLWIRQVLTVTKVELKRYILARRWIGVYLAAYAPVALLLFAAIQLSGRVVSIPTFRDVRIFYQTFMLRLATSFVRSRVFLL
jgi:hypothetical protein